MDLGLFIAGLVIGAALTGLRPESVVSAQAGWQCRSWTLESKGTADAIGPWLGTAARVEISAAGIEMNRQYALVACKQ
jgi:hypothetical protein